MTRNLPSLHLVTHVLLDLMEKNMKNQIKSTLAYIADHPVKAIGIALAIAVIVSIASCTVHLALGV